MSDARPVTATTPEEIRQAAHDKVQREAAVRAQLSAEAEYVMNNSKPTPSQAEVDEIKTGVRNIDDKEDPDNPTMPSVAEQQARIAEASGEAPVYRTRDVRADRMSDAAYPQHRRLQRAMDENPPPHPPTPAPAPAAPAPATPVLKRD